MSSPLVILTFAPAGLGHLRVTEAIRQGTPEGVKVVTYASADHSVSYIHRIMSTHAIGRGFMEWTQRGLPERLFTRLYIRWLKINTSKLYKDISEAIKNYQNSSSNVIIISSHFGLAHKLESIKKRLEANLSVKITHVVVVTDDSPQRIWCVKGAELTFVPSRKTKADLISLGLEDKIENPNIVVLPYPLDKRLIENLDNKGLSDKIDQVSPLKKGKIRLILPVSGAAVAMSYYETLLPTLKRKNKRFFFYIVSKKVPYTTDFLAKIKKKKYAKIFVSEKDSQVVENYTKLLTQKTIAFELTKPSEQTFKALLPGTSKGGVILLLNYPVGRQEEDNLSFLERHYLIPERSLNKKLWKFASLNKNLNDSLRRVLFKEACTWRAIRIPQNPAKAAKFILWCHAQGIFSQMLLCKGGGHWEDDAIEELGAQGVQELWNTVLNFASENES